MFHGLAVRAFALLSLLGLSACGHVPLSSLPALMKIDATTTDLAQLRVTLILPETVMPQPEGVRLTLAVEAQGFHETGEFALTEDLSPQDRAQVAARTKAQGRLMVFRLSDNAVQAVNSFRADMAARAPDAGRKLKVGIAADRLCLLPGGLQGAVLATVFLRTQETRDYVLLLDGVDLRGLKESRTVLASMPSCAGDAALTAPPRAAPERPDARTGARPARS